MKMKSVKIENFRNIKLFEFNFNETATIISGENELGKSNVLNALVWFFTDNIYTDNPGVGENDINSICPKDQIKGEHSSVTIEFENGPLFTKLYKTGYDRTTGKPNKHTTEGLINSVGCKNMNEWNSKLMEVINFTPTFTSVKELNLYVDPLYALQKLDAKQLRTLLVSFGCTVTNEELYKLGFEDLRQYESKYLGDFVNMRVDLKKQVTVIRESVARNRILFEQFNEIAKFDDSKLEAINKKINELNELKAKLVTGGNDEIVKDLELKLKERLITLNAENDKLINDIKLKISELESKKALEHEAINNVRANLTKEIRNDIKRIESEISSNETTLKVYNKSLDTLRSNLVSTQTAAKSLLNRKSDYQAKLVATYQRTFNGYLVCPCCGASFAPDENAENEFNNHKKHDIKFYTEEIDRFNQDLAKFKSECDAIVSDANNTKKEIASVEKIIKGLTESLESNRKALSEFDNTPIDVDKINDYDAQINKLKAELTKIPSTETNPKCIELKAKIESIKADRQAQYIEQLNNIDTQITTFEFERENLYIERSNWRQKLDYKNNLDKAIEKLNDVEALVERVNDFIHTMIKIINDKAKAKTGMDFVMLEENLGNDGVKEVCYAIVDDVPFAMINSSKKYQYGIKFIEKIKDIAVNDFGKARNDLPILADKFEGIDHIEKIKNLTKEQLICTRVGLEPNITIL